MHNDIAAAKDGDSQANVNERIFQGEFSELSVVTPASDHCWTKRVIKLLCSNVPLALVPYLELSASA